MSIRGIDTQIMITRSPDFSKDVSTVQQRPETNQQILAEQQKITAAQEQAQVKALDESEMEGIRTEEDGSGGGEYDGKGGHKPNEEEDPDDFMKPGMYVPPSNNILDIMV